MPKNITRNILYIYSTSCMSISFKINSAKVIFPRVNSLSEPLFIYNVLLHFSTICFKMHAVQSWQSTFLLQQKLSERCICSQFFIMYLYSFIPKFLSLVNLRYLYLRFLCHSQFDILVLGFGQV